MNLNAAMEKTRELMNASSCSQEAKTAHKKKYGLTKLEVESSWIIQ